MGFVLEPEEAQRLIEKDARNKDVLFPYLNGEDLNSRPDQSPSRWVINFFDWPINKAMEYPDCFRIVEERVKPDRVVNEYSKNAKEMWWLYERLRPELYHTTADLNRFFAGVLHTKYWSVACYQRGFVFSHALVVFAISSWADAAVLESHIHEAWARQYSGSLETRLRYSPTDCLETYPFPSHFQRTETAGHQYFSWRLNVLKTANEGLTNTYNRIHDANETSADIQKLRQLHIEMDNAVAAAYGWNDLRLGHGFHETKQGVRYTISEAARRGKFSLACSN
jgi:hypothetical protein